MPTVTSDRIRRIRNLLIDIDLKKIFFWLEKMEKKLSRHIHIYPDYRQLACRGINEQENDFENDDELIYLEDWS